MLDLPEVEREILTSFSMDCDRRDRQKRNLTLVPFRVLPKDSQKMAAGSVNCEAAFLNFYAKFERNR